jgi:DNA-binding transcriptional LysR family regulator
VIDLKLINHALVLARYRNYARAAEALEMSQPALSRSIAGLEADLGVKLFDRTRQGVSPTAFGERLLAHGNKLLADAVDLERDLKLMQGSNFGVLKIGAGPYPAELSVAEAIGRMAVKHPRLRIELDTSEVRATLQAVLRAELDFAVMELSLAERGPKFLVEPLPQHAGVFYCRAGHPLLEEKSPTLEHIFSYPFAAPRITARVAEAFYRLAKAGTIDRHTGDYIPAIKIDTFSAAKAVVRASNAIAAATLTMIGGEIEAGQIVALPFRPPWLHTNYGFISLRGRALSAAAQALMAEIKAVEAELAAAERRIDFSLRPTG